MKCALPHRHCVAAGATSGRMYLRIPAPLDAVADIETVQAPAHLGEPAGSLAMP